MLDGIARRIKRTLNRYAEWVCREEYEAQRFTRFNERPVEFEFVFRKLAHLYPRHILDIGTGTTALPHLLSNCGFLVTAIDNVKDYWPEGMTNRHYHVIDDDITQTRLNTTYECIICLSVIEHIVKPDDAIRNMFKLLTPNGHMILTFPYSEQRYVQNVYELPGSSYGQRAPYMCQSYSRVDLNRWMIENGGVIGRL